MDIQYVGSKSFSEGFTDGLRSRFVGRSNFIIGVQGLTGAKGHDGAQGIQGIKGDKGDTGATGNDGIPGIQGLPEIVGIKGDTGSLGSPGDPVTLINDASTSVSGLWSSKKMSDQLAAILALKWSEKFILNNSADGYISPSLPLSRNGTMAKIDFYVTGTPASATTITVKQGATTLSPTVILSAVGKTTLTFGTAVIGTEDDIFTYTVSGAGLVPSVVTCNQKWVNR